jgi:DNA polymerase-3 subunit gamma/tau
MGGEARLRTALHRLWQLLLKGHDEVLRANNPLEHLEMLLLRVIYAASLPDPGELAKLLESGGVPAIPLAAPTAPGGQESARAEPVAEAPASTPAEAPVAALTIAQIHQLLESTGNHQLARQVYDDLQLLELEPGLLIYAPAPALDGDFSRRLGEALLNQTGGRWQVRQGEGEGRPSLGQMRAAKLADNDSRIRELPVVKAAFAAFPEARFADDSK